ncbi:TPR REGION domain-containing protein [Citrus sinensis]|uniref:TPR REGION domain-containing protein n=1 Tax=Citrus sinensis TaxID=2711 RepID=A0ACB8MC79_CITSI|nr:TPR REGION domain-containing protein [Citrus sinensis]
MVMLGSRGRLDFLNSKPPANYIAGAGRGASGFTTRSDIGPARTAPPSTIIGLPRPKPRDDDGEDDNDDDGNNGYQQNFDHFEGNDAGLFANSEYDDEDKEADAVWESIDKRMEEEFVDLKGKLTTVKAKEWERIPEIGDYSRSNKRKRFESFVPVPDSLLQKARQEQQHVIALDPSSRAAGGAESVVTDLTAVGEGRGKILTLKLDGISDSVTGLTVVDLSGYLTRMNDLKITTNSELRDILKARKIEEAAARKLITKGCNMCPKNEDVWLEACRLARPDEAKGVVAKGVRQIPKSVRLWLQAAELDHDKANKSRVLRMALDEIPDSVRLWKALVEISSEEEARILLHRAVECCPLDVELWLALARLETYGVARSVLNKARKKLPKERAIWIAAAKLEEANGNTSMVGKIIERGIRALQGEEVVIDRDTWMKEAEIAEKAGSAQLEKTHGSRESLIALLRKAVTYFPQAEVLWLMGAKEKWLAGDVPAARDILQEAYATIPNSEEIWLAAFKLEFENRELERARMLLAKARDMGGTERVWMKSAIVERELGNNAEERGFIEEGLKRFPSFFNLWLMLGQLEERLGHLKEAKEAYQSGCNQCPNCIPLWYSLANLEEKRNGLNGLSKARAVLSVARSKNPLNPEIWLATIRAESKHGNKKEADSFIAKALQKCPNSGILWAELIKMVPHHDRKSKGKDALVKSDRDPHVFAAVAKLFWHDRKVDKARNWFNKAVSLDPDTGDFWALYYKFELQHGGVENQKEVLNRCIAAEPKHGEKWRAISKAVENSHCSTEAILMKVVNALGEGERRWEGGCHEYFDGNTRILMI